MSHLTHLDETGAARMVDVGGKQPTEREACAMATIKMQADTLSLLMAGDLPKGDVFPTARIAGIQAAKKCAELIPLCHPLMLTGIAIDFEVDKTASLVKVIARCKLNGKTGVEMEALTAASVAALTLYDMCKAVDKQMVIGNICVLEKRGGKSGDWVKVTSNLDFKIAPTTFNTK